MPMTGSNSPLPGIARCCSGCAAHSGIAGNPAPIAARLPVVMNVRRLIMGHLPLCRSSIPPAQTKLLVCAHRYRYDTHTNPNKRSEEHTSELQSLMRISYAVFCLKKKKIQTSTRQNIATDK